MHVEPTRQGHKHDPRSCSDNNCAMAAINNDDMPENHTCVNANAKIQVRCDAARVCICRKAGGGIDVCVSESVVINTVAHSQRNLCPPL